MTTIGRLFLTLLSTLLAGHVAGQSLPLDRLKGNRGGEVILASIEAMGGWEAWSKKTDVQYERYVTRYEEDGHEIKEKQCHRFVLPPRILIRQETEREGKRIVTGFDGRTSWDGGSLRAYAKQYLLCRVLIVSDLLWHPLQLVRCQEDKRPCARWPHQNTHRSG